MEIQITKKPWTLENGRSAIEVSISGVEHRLEADIAGEGVRVVALADEKIRGVAFMVPKPHALECFWINCSMPREEAIALAQCVAQAFADSLLRMAVN